MSLRDELIQVAAVACAIIEDLDTGHAEAAESFVEVIHGDVWDEQLRQVEKWGSQHHTPVEWLMILLEEVGEAAEGDWVILGNHGESTLLERAAFLGQAAKAWSREHDWPDPKHRAIHRQESA